MSTDSVAMELNKLTFDTPAVYLPRIPPVNIVPPSKRTGETRKGKQIQGRNRPCIPSDDEEEDEEDEDEDEDEEGDDKHEGETGAVLDETSNRTAGQIRYPAGQSFRTHPTSSAFSKPRRTQPLPSDDEYSSQGSDDEDRGTLASHALLTRAYPPEFEEDRNSYEQDDDNSPILTSHARLSEKKHHSQTPLYHPSQVQQAFASAPPSLTPSPSFSSSHLRPGTPSYHQRVSLSGMELLKQREQEKADAKRQKPKIDPSKAKIEGLLAHLPQPGSHSINFQQMQQQYNRTTRPLSRPSSSLGHGDPPMATTFHQLPHQMSNERRPPVAYPHIMAAYDPAYAIPVMYPMPAQYLSAAGPMVYPGNAPLMHELPTNHWQRRPNSPFYEYGQ